MTVENWVKWVKGLSKRREVIVLARKLGISRREAASACMELWDWADGETTDGHIRGATRDDIDLMLGLPGFSSALESEEVGWLRVNERGITFPRWERHNGKTAKKRALEQRKKKRQMELEDEKLSRDVRDKCPEDVPPKRKSKRERKSNESPNGDSLTPLPPSLDSPEFAATWADWLAYRRSKGKAVSGMAAKQQLEKLAEVGPLRAAETIRTSIANDWQGLFPEKVTNGNRHARPEPGPGQQYRAGSELGSV